MRLSPGEERARPAGRRGQRGRDDVLIWGGRATLSVDSSGSSGEDGSRGVDGRVHDLDSSS